MLAIVLVQEGASEFFNLVSSIYSLVKLYPFGKSCLGLWVLCLGNLLKKSPTKFGGWRCVVRSKRLDAAVRHRDDVAAERCLEEAWRLRWCNYWVGVIGVMGVTGGSAL